MLKLFCLILEKVKEICFLPQNTKLGWVISGINTSSENTFLTFSTNEEGLENIFPKFWKLEEVENSYQSAKARKYEYNIYII